MKVTEAARANWAVLIYSSASPDIEAAARASLREVGQVRSHDSVVVGAQLGVKEHGRAVAHRYCLGQGTPELPTPEASLAGADMSQPESLADFLRWGMRRFPAEHYLVVLGGHGGGFLGAVSDVERRRFLRPEQMAEGLEAAGMTPDVLVLNACLMAQTELACELYPRAHYLVAAQGGELAEGIPLGRVVERLASPDCGPEAAARATVEACAEAPGRTPTMSAVRLAGLPALVESLNRLSGEVRGRPDLHEAVREVLRKTPDFWKERPWDRPLTQMRDLLEFARGLEQHPDLRGSGPARVAAELREQVEDLVLATTSGVPGAHGLSLYLPDGPDTEAVLERYLNLRLARRTGWDEMLEELGRPAAKVAECSTKPD